MGCTGADLYHVGQTYPVEGTVFVDKSPCGIPKDGYGRIWLYPDTNKGNQCPQVPVGELDSEGRFRIATRSLPGAPAGWYKVQVVAKAPPGKRKSDKGTDLVPAKYGNVKESGLALEVVAEPRDGMYDLKLRR
jgi:hypothetical protein